MRWDSDILTWQWVQWDTSVTQTHTGADQTTTVR